MFLKNCLRIYIYSDEKLKTTFSIMALKVHNNFIPFINYVNNFYFKEVESCLGLVSLGGTGRDDISMQLASPDFRPCWIYT